MDIDWKKSPQSLEVVEIDRIDYILAVDESGTNHYCDEKNKWLTLAGVAIDVMDYKDITTDLMKLKKKYWEDGMFYNKRVIFHSRDILKRQKAFCYSGLIDYENFKADLCGFISKLPLNIISSNIDKERLIEKYYTPHNTYNLAVTFMIERYVILLEDKNKTGIIVFESRGNKEDSDLLKFIVNLLSKGNQYISSNKFSKRIIGIFFNKKYTADYLKSYWVLELADICSNAIYNHLKDTNGNTFFKSEIFPIIESKFICYPTYIGKGMKTFPK